MTFYRAEASIGEKVPFQSFHKQKLGVYNLNDLKFYLQKFNLYDTFFSIRQGNLFHKLLLFL